MIAWRMLSVSIILVLKSCNFFPYVSFKKRRNYALWRGIISVHLYSFYGFRVANILNEILLSNPSFTFVTQPSRTILPQTTSNEDCVLNRFRKTCFLKCTQKKQWSFSSITSHYHSLFSSLGLLLLVLIRLIIKAEFPAWWIWEPVPFR